VNNVLFWRLREPEKQIGPGKYEKRLYFRKWRERGEPGMTVIVAMMP